MVDLQLKIEQTKIIDFKGHKILQIEVDILKQIEKSTGKIPVVNEIKYDTFGFQVKENGVVSLGLFTKKLTSLPESIGNLTNLQYLGIQNNQLTSLPKSLGSLTNLEHLSLKQNKLTSLPENIGNLTNLKHLDLCFNKLTSLPESLGNLINLTHLSLSNDNPFYPHEASSYVWTPSLNKWIKDLKEQGCSVFQ